MNDAEIAGDVLAATAAGKAAKVSLGGTVAASVFGWLTQEGVATFISLCIAAAGLLLTWYYARKKYRLEHRAAEAKERRAVELHDAQLRYLNGGGGALMGIVND
jgi:hypothetical protein